MFTQIALGSAMLILSIIIASGVFMAMEALLLRASGWLEREPHRPKLIVVLMAASLGILGQITIAVWMWALLLWGLDLFHTIEMAVYFSLTCFTTLGFGDVLLPQDWRLLGGLAATNGLLNIGFVTAVMVETLRYIRQSQIEALRRVRHD